MSIVERVVDNPYDAEFEDEIEFDGDDDVAPRPHSTVVRIVAALCAAALFLSAGSVLAIRVLTSAADGPCDADPVAGLDFAGQDVHDTRRMLEDRELYCDGDPVEVRVVGVVMCHGNDGESTTDQLRDAIARADSLRTDRDTGKPVLRVVVCGDALSV